ncbi:protein-arginine deiminase type-1-like [Thamnophis elegans]|uniref:protein-arginine deiminase type-1-like n=1 Tax=Thamnophis elegans TaxID=35005 RepID=UPI0013771660|nr:protein-arginine deiminase type-1-like [Thamnophis elegans]
MAELRCVQLSTEKVTSSVYILGTELCLDIHGAAPRTATSFEIWASQGLNIYKIKGQMTKSKVCCHDSKWLLDKSVKFRATMDAPSNQVDDEKIRVLYYEGKGNVPIAKAILHITGIEMSLDADTNRSGTVTKGGKQKDQWTWGPDGKGAILLVNCDRDNPKDEKEDNKDIKLTSKEDLQDMSRMILTTQGPNEVFANYQLTLHISKADCDKVGVFYSKSKKEKKYYKHVLGSEKISYHVKRKPCQVESVFYVEGLKFPDIDFSGLVTFHASLLEPVKKEVLQTSIFTDTLVFRVAPWIMTPNTLQPITVYVCSVEGNKEFVEHIKKLATKAGCKFIISPEEKNRGDRWIQDEMEFGYVQAPHKTFPVVFDSPRNRELDYFPFKKVLGPDFGYVKRELSSNASPSSLDSFGNLEVSPPVNAKSKEYPLGRILIGSSFPSSKNAPMSKLVKDFLHSQVVQSPIELYTDWLNVGHVDEFLSFVPAPDRKGFRLLLASPSACFKLLKEKVEEGHGEAKMPGGIEFQKGDRQPRPISEILADGFIRKWNDHCQRCINWNKGILKEELGLEEEDIIEIPQLFHPYLALLENSITLEVNASAEAYFPDMVNMIVLGKHLGIPKPFGPIIDGQCCLEKEVRRLLEPLGLSCNFVDDYGTYYLNLGDVHCGTNVRRKPFSFQWWNMRP